MANAGCVNKRLLLALLRTPATRSNSVSLHHHHGTPRHWVRTITNSSTKNRRVVPSISFGEENDGVIAPYIEKSNKKVRGTKNKKPEVTPSEPAVDDYEISGFIDRSSLSSAQNVLSIDDAVTVVGEGSVSQAAERSGRKNKQERRKAAEAHGTTRKAKGVPRREKREDGFIRKLETRPPIVIRKHNSATSADMPSIRRTNEEQESTAPEPWMIQKSALKQKFEEGWNPRKKLSPDAMEGIRGLHEQDPVKYTTELLAEQFKISPEAIRRILKSKWLSQQSPEKLQERRERWAKRHDRIWDQQAELGLRPQRRRDKEVEDPDKFEQDLERRRVLGEI